MKDHNNYIVGMVEILESCLVAPNEETPKHRLWLSNLDLLCTPVHTPTIHIYRPNGDPNFFSVETLKAALSKALVPFYPLAGRLDMDERGRLEINCTGEGAHFMVARSESTIDDFGDFAPSPEIKRLFVPSQDSGDPPSIILLFQVTFFKCGGVCLGAATHHSVVDGLGSLHFINSWSDFARGIEVSISPYLDRNILRARSPPTVQFEHVEYTRTQQTESVKEAACFDSIILKLSNDQLKALKNNRSNSKKSLSTFKVVASHIWRCVCKARARELTSDQETRLYITGDARSRLRPPLPPGYIGNAIFRKAVVATVGEIMSNSIEFGANKMDVTTAQMDDEYVRSVIDFLELLEDEKRLVKGKWTAPMTDLWVTSWQGLPTYGMDFGWGKPALMRRAILQFRGMVYITHNPGNDGGLSVVVGLEPEHISHFKEVFYEDLDCVGRV